MPFDTISIQSTLFFILWRVETLQELDTEEDEIIDIH